MPLTTSSVSPEPKRPAEPTKASPKRSDLAPAGESGNPAVQHLLAQRQTAVLNDDQVAIATIDKTLHEEHGVSAG